MSVVVVFGVAGSGKSTVGAALAHRMGVEFADGDDFHPAANVIKMTAGQPLSDADRWPWLDRIRDWMSGHPTGVVACSALRRVYRDRLRPARFVYLRIDLATALERSRTRHGHFFKPAMVESQFTALEEPAPDENVLTVDSHLSVAEMVDLIVFTLAPARRSQT